MALGNIAKMINKAAEEKNPAEQLVADLESMIKQQNAPRKPKPNYKPSMLGGCKRRTFFCKTGAEIDGNYPAPSMVGIWESGHARHDKIQKYISEMKAAGYDWEWIDVSEYVEQRKPPGTIVVSKQGMETKLYNEILGLSFLCDGVVRYKGRYYIIEIKTETSFKFMKHTKAHEEHLKQGTCYSVGLGIDEVIFIYENRDVCSKKTDFIEITEDMKHRFVIDIIEDINNHIEAGTIPPAERDKCNYCDYKKECKKWGD